MLTEGMPKKKPAVAIAVEMGGKMKPNTFKLPKGYTSEDEGEVKEALLKYKENDDGTCEMISLDGAPFDGGGMEEEGEKMPDDENQEQDMAPKDDEMPADMPMEDAIGALQKRDRNRY